MLHYYEITFVVSLLLTLVYVFIWHKHFDVNMTLIFSLIPIAEFGYMMIFRSRTIGEALSSNAIIYFGGCYLSLFIMLSIYNLCRIELNKYLRLGFFMLCTLIFLSALSAGSNPLFYKSMEYSVGEDGSVYFSKEYGFVHTLFYCMIALYMILSIFAIIYSLLKKKDEVSGGILKLLFFPELLSFVTFFSGVDSDRIYFNPMPLTYIVAQIVYLLVIHRASLYNIDDTMIDSLVQNGGTGFIAFDFNLRYLGSNETAKSIFPALRELSIDSGVEECEGLKDNIMEWMRTFCEDPDKDRIIYSSERKSYAIEVSSLFDGIHKRGWYLLIRDDTANQNYISLMNRYNTDLRAQVDQKTEHIIEMHDRLIMSMASMVESRDNSTGGHIRRTSRIVGYLMEEIMKENEFGLTEDFCRNIIKAAPMHDLGKIAVDDAILRKPGRFTDEEFEKMKLHASEGAKIVHEILVGTEDVEFAEIAENIAHYHHERWDGSGYPLGLKGDDIPLEARIMAIADVYDALVSKRVYKEKMSFEQANSIIMDGMGKHFDKRLEKCYVRARPKFEAFYRFLELN